MYMGVLLTVNMSCLSMFYMHFPFISFMRLRHLVWFLKFHHFDMISFFFWLLPYCYSIFYNFHRKLRFTWFIGTLHLFKLISYCIGGKDFPNLWLIFIFLITWIYIFFYYFINISAFIGGGFFLFRKTGTFRSPSSRYFDRVCVFNFPFNI